MLLLIQISLIISQIALIAAIIIFTYQSIVFGISGGFDVPFVATPHSYFPLIARALNIRDGDLVYDLGSGSGELLLYLAKKFPNARFVGIERNLFLHTQARIKKKFTKVPNVAFRRENFFTTDLGDATRIYVYLLPSILERLFSISALRCRIASRAFAINGRPVTETVELSQRPGWHGQHLLHIYEL